VKGSQRESVVRQPLWLACGWHVAGMQQHCEAVRDGGLAGVM
jgi:hypothetical protein